MEDHASQLANKAAAAASKRNPGPELASVLCEVCGLLVSLNARISSLENEAGFRDYTSFEVPDNQAAASADPLSGKPAEPGPSPPGEPVDAGAECPEPVAVAKQLPSQPEDPKKKGPAPVAPQPAELPVVAPQPAPGDPTTVMLEISERFASMSRKQAALYAAAIKANNKGPAAL